MLYIALSILHIFNATFAEDNSRSELENFSSTYGVEFVAAREPEQTPNDAMFTKASEYLANEIKKHYTPEFIRASSLKKVILSRDIPGNAAGKAIHAEHAILIDANYVVKTFSQINAPSEYIKNNSATRCNSLKDESEKLTCLYSLPKEPQVQSINFDTFNHELFHLIDFSFLQKIESRYRWTYRWNQLNIQGFRYASLNDDYIESVNKSVDLGLKKEVGFISSYATVNIREDRAETYGSFVFDPLKYLELAKDDPILLEKAKLIREMIEKLCSDSRPRRRPIWGTRPGTDYYENSQQKKCDIPKEFNLLPKEPETTTDSRRSFNF